jgi:hypothetical protein
MRLLVVLAVLALPAIADATLLRASTLRERLGRADLVFVGRLAAERTLRVDGHVMTESRFTVRETLLGAKVSEAAVTHFGGREGALVYDVPGDPSFVPNRDYLLITYLHRDGRRYLVAMGLGVFEVEGEALRQSVDVGLVGEDGVVRPGPIETISSLAEVRALVSARGRR